MNVTMSWRQKMNPHFSGKMGGKKKTTYKHTHTQKGTLITKILIRELHGGDC